MNVALVFAGGSGSGKSTLCNILSKELNLPEIHLDSINYTSNWVEIDKKLIINSNVASLGTHNVEIELHKNVRATLKVNVKKES